MNNKPSLSVIIPIYNEERTVVKLLNSLSVIIEYCNMEVIVIDDGSTDTTNKKLKENKKLYHKLISLKKNKGKGKAVIEG